MTTCLIQSFGSLLFGLLDFCPDSKHVESHMVLCRKMFLELEPFLKKMQMFDCASDTKSCQTSVHRCTTARSSRVNPRINTRVSDVDSAAPEVLIASGGTWKDGLKPGCENMNLMTNTQRKQMSFSAALRKCLCFNAQEQFRPSLPPSPVSFPTSAVLSLSSPFSLLFLTNKQIKGTKTPTGCVLQQQCGGWMAPSSFRAERPPPSGWRSVGAVCWSAGELHRLWKRFFFTSKSRNAVNVFHAQGQIWSNNGNLKKKKIFFSDKK